MSNSYFTNENQLQQWIVAAEGIKDEFGIEKALGYLIGEKFYDIASDNLFARKMIRTIDEQRTQPGYNPLKEYDKGKTKRTINLDDEYDKYLQRIIQTEDILAESAILGEWGKSRHIGNFPGNIKINLNNRSKRRVFSDTRWN